MTFKLEDIHRSTSCTMNLFISHYTDFRNVNVDLELHYLHLLKTNFNNEGYSQGKSTLKLNSSAYEKYESGHLGRWYIKLTLFKSF